MTQLSSRALTPTELANWDTAVERYNAIINANAAIRVQQMSAEDLRRYSDRFNIASASSTDVLDYMFRWGGFRELIISGGLTSLESALFTRLLNGREPLPHPPPRYFKQPWYALFDLDNTSFECTVKLQGISTRKRDAGKKIFVLQINECPWECVSMSDAAQRLFEIDMQWSSPGSPARSDLWLETRSLLIEPVSVQVKFGRWDDTFILSLDSRDQEADLGAALAIRNQPDTNSVLGLTFETADFPMRWLLSRS